MTPKKARLIGFQLGLVKKAIDLESLLSGAKENAPLIGAGAGGLAGLVSGMGGDEEAPEEEQKSPMLRALIGALLGGAGGMGAKHGLGGVKDQLSGLLGGGDDALPPDAMTGDAGSAIPAINPALAGGAE